MRNAVSQSRRQMRHQNTAPKTGSVLAMRGLPPWPQGSFLRRVHRIAVHHPGKALNARIVPIMLENTDV